MSSPSPYKIPIVDPPAQYRMIRAEIRQAIDEVADSQLFVLGPAVRRFEKQIAHYLGCFGDGGLVTTRDKKLEEKARRLRVHGERVKYHHQEIGINSRLDSIQAAVLSVKQRFLDRWCERRIERARTYQQLFLNMDLVGDEILSLPPVPDDRSRVFNNYVIRARPRDDLKRFLAQQGIQSEIYSPLPRHLQSCFAYLSYKPGDFPGAELAATEVLALPLYPRLTLEQPETVARAVAAFYRK